MPCRRPLPVDHDRELAASHDGPVAGSYTAPVVDEPVRGRFPDPSFYSLPGIEQARAWLRGLTPRSPLSHLTGLRPTEVGSGSATLTMPASPWLQLFDGTIDTRLLAQDALEFAVLTTAPAATGVRTGVFVLNHLRPCTVDSKMLTAKARTVHSGPTFTLAEVILEDSLGRGVARATATFVMRSIRPTPPPWTPPATPPESAAYASPDPYARPISSSLFSVEAGGTAYSFLADIAARKRPRAPVHELFDIRILEVGEGTLALLMRATEWLCGRVRQVSPGVLAYLANTAHGAAATLMPPGHRLGVLSQSVTFLRPVAPDGQDLLARGRVTRQGDEFVVSQAEILDAAGNTVAFGALTSLFIQPRPSSPTEPERVLATVLFTDIVRSTEQVERLGDARWRRLLEQHHTVVRREIELFKGQEVKTTGDGFLVTFDSPGRAVQCAMAIRDAVQRLGLDIRAGLHSGECEVSGGDMAGIAVHIASRVQGQAAPGEVLVSGTLRDLVTGSGLRFEDRGRHSLKGIAGEWPILAVVG